MPAEYPEIVFLTGFMGAGKSTIGKILAELLACPFVDLDNMIVVREGRTIAEIFASDGEEYFRDCETVVLKSLRQQPLTVYATGGGIVSREENRLLMKSLGRIVYLKASWPVLQGRLKHSTGRPLANRDRNWHDVRSLWQSRQPFYEEADLIIDTDGLAPHDVAEKILAGL